MKKINDPIFGEMEYRYSWKRNMIIRSFGQEFQVELNVNDLDEEGILDTQRDAYRKVENNISQYIDDNSDKLADYCVGTFALTNISSPTILSHLRPKTLVFQRDGTWGVLFDCDYDIEHGIALYFKKEDVFVGVQDDFL